MIVAHNGDDWRASLPKSRGRIGLDVPLAPLTWFRVGGPAEVLFRPMDVGDLGQFLRHLPPACPVTVIGAASNLIVRDGGIRGVVVKLGRGFGDIAIENDGIVAGAAALDITIAQYAAAAGLTGLEFCSGIPGSLGGAIAMNAGAYGSEIKDVLDWVDIVGPDGTLARYDVSELTLRYRHAVLPGGGIVVRGRLRARSGDPAMIAARIEEIRASREAAQPVRARTGGSTFRNPDGEKAWRLIDAAGCRGMRLGGAQVSEKHCNFMINLGAATAADLETLGEDVRGKVRDTFGIDLEWEIRRMGIR